MLSSTSGAMLSSITNQGSLSSSYEHTARTEHTSVRGDAAFWVQCGRYAGAPWSKLARTVHAKSGKILDRCESKGESVKPGLQLGAGKSVGGAASQCRVTMPGAST